MRRSRTSTPSRATSASRFRSWTTCSMSRGRARNWERRPARTPPPAKSRIRPCSASRNPVRSPRRVSPRPRPRWRRRRFQDGSKTSPSGRWNDARNAHPMKPRLDQLLVSRGLVSTRERARALILAGDVTVNGQVVSKAGTAVDESAAIALRTPDHPWVGRGGIKLAHVLDACHVAVEGASALDIGASTGGFPDVLLQRGAQRVVAIDVGHNQLDWKIRSDPRVVAIEGLNARQLRAEDLPADAAPFDVITIDVSFISLKHILPRVPSLVAPGGRVV